MAHELVHFDVLDDTAFCDALDEKKVDILVSKMCFR